MCIVAELKIVEWLELVSLVSDNGDPLECWPCMGDTELVPTNIFAWA